MQRRVNRSMDKGKMGTVTIVITMAILVVVFLLILFASFRQTQPRITLPEEPASVDETVPDGENGSGALVSPVEVTADTVQNVIATLHRPEGYGMRMTITTYWSGGSGQTQVYSAVRDGVVRTDLTLPGGQVRHALRTGAQTYVWYNKESAVSVLNNGDFSADDEQWIPTYEDLLQAEPQRIAAAGYESQLDVDCIYAVTAEDSRGYSERYWVSVQDGLLIAAERLQDGQTVYRMEMTELTAGEQDAAQFTLPDGTVLLPDGASE